MTPVNFNQLYYFYLVAREGSIARISELLHITPQTISGQISALEHSTGSALFNRTGKKWSLTEMGRVTFRYAEDIFQLGDELRSVLKHHTVTQWQTFTVGITDVLPKAFIYELLKPVFSLPQQLRLICREGEQNALLAELAVNKLDLVLTDEPLSPGSSIKAYNHEITESGTSFFASTKLLKKLPQQQFPACLHQQPMLLQSKRSIIRQRLEAWFEQQGIAPQIVAEFDDSAMMKAFGQQGLGIFSAPTQIEQKICQQYEVQVIGRSDAVREVFYAISPERKLTHPGVLQLVNALSSARTV
ncbi:transcriptional activator NhaR [Rheinheimera sp.]|uniref:transcriptional activator NhaR n=1 Tax=Rheinheimera sp. TaxID=1869214 RepID=UPI0027BA39C3|nr:transcriptional activator NhaR [Rheinheimera sp.]